MHRTRRMRRTPVSRSLVRETRVSKESLIYPLFFEEGENIRTPIPSLPGQYRYSPDRAAEIIDELLLHGVNKVLLFGIPKEKNPAGSSAYDDNGVVQNAIRAIRREYGDQIYIITDVCMCEYTSHGHCGILRDRYVDNDETLPFLNRIAVSHARAGADMVAPSDMMDGRVAAIRRSLDEAGFTETPILSYAAKFASGFYAPFRNAAGSAPAFGDRKQYQMDVANGREAIREALYDEEEGADILMVKPAIAFLDVIKELSCRTDLPICTYSVSGEYAMIKAASAAGVIDEYAILCETTTSFFRAGADMLITYFAKEAADAIRKGDIG